MNFELYKELKEKGFPQTYTSNCEVYYNDGNIHFFHIEEDGCYIDDDVIDFSQDFMEKNYIKIPSRTDIVSACNGNFIRMFIGDDGWCAEGKDKSFNSLISPDIALIDLWLFNN